MTHSIPRLQLEDPDRSTDTIPDHMLPIQFAELLQVPLLLTFQVPLAACEVDAAIASKSEEARRSLESSGEREGVQRVIFFMC